MRTRFIIRRIAGVATGCVGTALLCACSGSSRGTEPENGASPEAGAANPPVADGGGAQADGTADASDAGLSISSDVGLVSVSNNQLVHDGTQWITHGFYQIAFEVPPTVQNAKAFWTVASQNYSPQEYADMRSVGADSVRIQIGQPGMDPQDALYSQPFSASAIAAIHAARAAGLTVIVSLQDEAQSGGATPPGLPTDATQRVWYILAPIFGDDRGVLFELFNEPSSSLPSPQDWQAWATAMNATITTVRSTGAVNVVIADGVNFAEDLTGAPALADPLGQAAYASHPYPHAASDQTSSAWDSKFGNFSMTAPVIVTEWGNGYYCDENTAASDVQFFQYLQAHSIGLELVAWDWSTGGFTSARYDFPNGQFSSFVGPSGPLTCTVDGYGSGKTADVWYRTGVPATSIQ